MLLISGSPILARTHRTGTKLWRVAASALTNGMNRITRSSATWLALGAALIQLPAVMASEKTGNASSMPTQEVHKKTRERPEYVTALETIYGGPSHSGFGSAVFYGTLSGTDKLSEAAKNRYRDFVGERWERFGEEAWMRPWNEVYVRERSTRPDIVTELRGISDRDARQSVPMILDNVEHAEAGRSALSGVFDDTTVTELRVFNLGDGEAMSGLLVAGRRGVSGETTFLVFLMD